MFWVEWSHCSPNYPIHTRQKWPLNNSGRLIRRLFERNCYLAGCSSQLSTLVVASRGWKESLWKRISSVYFLLWREGRIIRRTRATKIVWGKIRNFNFGCVQRKQPSILCFVTCLPFIHPSVFHIISICCIRYVPIICRCLQSSAL